MDWKQITGLVVGVVIGALLLTTLVIPVIGEASTTEHTFTNDGYFDLNKIDATDTTEHTIVWSVSDAKMLTVDGVDLDTTTWGLGSYQQVTVFATETDLFRLGVPGSTGPLQWIQIRGATIGYAQANSSFQATISGGNVSVQLDSELSPRTLTYTDAYIITPDGDYVMKKSNESAYLNADSVIYGMGYTAINYDGSTTSTVFKVTGTIENMTAESVITTDPAITTSNIEVDYSEASNYIDLYSFDKVTFTATRGEDDTDCTYSYVIVPKEITAELAQHLDSGSLSLLQIVPLLITVGIIMAVVGVFVIRRE